MNTLAKIIDEFRDLIYANRFNPIKHISKRRLLSLKKQVDKEVWLRGGC